MPVCGLRTVCLGPVEPERTSRELRGTADSHVGGRRRTGDGQAGTAPAHPASGRLSAAVQALRQHATEGRVVLRSTGLRQDAAGEGDRQ